MITLGLLVILVAVMAITCVLALLGGAIGFLVTFGDVIFAILMIGCIIKYFVKKWRNKK